MHNNLIVAERGHFRLKTKAKLAANIYIIEEYRVTILSTKKAKGKKIAAKRDLNYGQHVGQGLARPSMRAQNDTFTLEHGGHRDALDLRRHRDLHLLHRPHHLITQSQLLEARRRPTLLLLALLLDRNIRGARKRRRDRRPLLINALRLVPEVSQTESFKQERLAQGLQSLLLVSGGDGGWGSGEAESTGKPRENPKRRREARLIVGKEGSREE